MNIIKQLNSLSQPGMKLGLERITELLKRMDNPEKKLKLIQIGGTNGKGSVCAMLNAILKEKYRVGLYTSPHIKEFNERIQINNKMITNDEIKEFLEKYKDDIKNIKPTFFELVTALALYHFYSEKIDYGIMEVGLGGRLDATTATKPICTAITSVDYDHTDILGDKIEKITEEKAGIIKSGVPTFLNETQDETIEIVRKKAEEKGSPFYYIPEVYHAEDIMIGKEVAEFSVKGLNDEYRIEIPLIGKHQIQNALMTIGIVELLFPKLERKIIENGFQKTIWPGRFQIFSNNPKIIVDCAHNVSGARSLIENLKLYEKKPLFIVGMMKDKDIDGFLKIISEHAKNIIVTEIDDERSMPLEDLKNLAKKYFENITSEKNSHNAFELSVKNSDFIVITGSIYLVGEAFKWMEKEPFS